MSAKRNSFIPRIEIGNIFNVYFNKILEHTPINPPYTSDLRIGFVLRLANVPHGGENSLYYLELQLKEPAKHCFKNPCQCQPVALVRIEKGPI